MKIAVAAKSTNYFQNIKLQKKKKKIETSDCIYCHITGEKKKQEKNSLDPYDGKHKHTHTQIHLWCWL